MVFGHEDIITFFDRLVRNHTLSHAYLFFGDKGVGKCSFAKLLAHRLEHGSFSETGILLDARVFSPEDGTIGIDAVREIKYFLSQTPLYSSRVLAIVDNAETLTPEAQSALLKVVEEPGRYGMLIFVTQTPEALFTPLLSRLSKVYFRRFSVRAIEEVLTHRFGLERRAAHIAAEHSWGSVERALEVARGNAATSEADFEKDLERSLATLYFKSPQLNFSRLKATQALAVNARRYHLNIGLQKRALNFLHHSSL